MAVSCPNCGYVWRPKREDLTRRKDRKTYVTICPKCGTKLELIDSLKRITSKRLEAWGYYA